MCYIELKNDKYETSEDLKHLLQYILRLDKTAEDSQRANTITNTLAGCQPAMISTDLLLTRAFFSQLPTEYETYSVFETILHKLQNEYVH